MKRALPYSPFIPAPSVLAEDAARPAPVATTTVAELCALAHIPKRVTSPHTPPVVLHRGSQHFRDRGAYYVGLGRRTFGGRDRDAMRVLEILAHGFHDYAARENVCGRGLFVAPGRRGRPALRGRPMSAAERMRRMRSRRTSR